MTPQGQTLMKQFVQIPHSPYGEQLSTLVEMKLETGGQVEEVLQLIKELLDQLKLDQLNDDNDHANKMAQFNANIEILEVDLTRLNKELSDTNDLLKRLADELQALQDSINTLEKQLEILNGQEQLIRDARASDIKAYQRRVESANKVINALNLIIEKLRNAIDQQDGQGTEAVLAQIRKELGPNHPISVLISMTAKFDVPTVQRILEKLVTIRDGAVASLNEDNAAELVAAEAFEKSITEIEGIRKKLSDELDSCQQQYKTKQVQQTIAQAQKKQLLIDIPITESILEATKIQRDQFHSAYLSRSEQRAQEIKVVEQAYNLIFDHVDSVRKQEQLSNALNQ